MSSYYLPREDSRWEADAERAAESIRAEIADHLRTPDGRPVFVGWLDYDGLDAVGSPIVVPTVLTEGQAVAHAAVVEALVNFLECLDIDDDAIEKRVETMRDGADADRFDQWRDDRKAS